MKPREVTQRPSAPTSVANGPIPAQQMLGQPALHIIREAARLIGQESGRFPGLSVSAETRPSLERPALAGRAYGRH